MDEPITTRKSLLSLYIDVRITSRIAAYYPVKWRVITMSHSLLQNDLY